MILHKRFVRFGICALLIVALDAALAFGDPYAASREPDPISIKGFVYDVGDGLRLGPVHLHGYVSEFATYDTNLFLAKSATADFVFDTLFGVRADINLSDHLLSLYFDGESLNSLANASTFDKFNYRGGLKGRLLFKDFYANLDGSWKSETDHINTRLTAWPDLTEQELDVSLDMGFRLGRISVELGGNLWMRMFDTSASPSTQTVTLGDGSSIQVDADYLNNFEGVGHLRLAYMLAKLRVFVAGSFGLVQFTGADILHDYTYFSVVAGGTLKLTGKVDASAVVGYSMQMVSGLGDYQTLADDSEFSGIVGTFDLTYHFSEKLRGSVGFVQAMQFSGSSNYQVYDTLYVSVAHRILRTLSWSIKGRVEYIDPSDNYNFTLYGGSGVVDWRLFSWAGLGLEIDFEMRSAHDSAQSYTTFAAALVLTLFL